MWKGFVTCGQLKKIKHKKNMPSQRHVLYSVEFDGGGRSSQNKFTRTNSKLKISQGAKPEITYITGGLTLLIIG